MGEHDPFIRAAIAVGESAMAHGNSPFGALLVQDGRVLLCAENTVITGRDPTAHAELNLVRLAGAAYNPAELAGSILYASTEPCPMCAAAIAWAGIGTVVYGCSAEQMDSVGDAGFGLTCHEVFARARHPVTVIGPVLEEEAMQAHRAFWPPFLQRLASEVGRAATDEYHHPAVEGKLHD